MGDNDCNFVKEDDITNSSIIVLVILVCEAFVGMWINSFIMAVNCVGCVKQRCLSSTDNILAVLAFSRFCFLLKTTLQTFCSTFYPEIYYLHSVFQAFRAVTWFLNSSNQWFAACLCVFYCVKIANFSHPLFIWLKFKISRLVPWLLLGSVLFSLFSSLPFLNAIYKIECNDFNSSLKRHYNAKNVTVETSVSQVLSICGTGFSMAFTIFIISASLLLFSLWRHTQQMQNNSSSFRSPCMEAHIQAMKTIVSFFLINIVNFIALLTLLTNIYQETSPASIACTIIVDACPSVHSVILILSNPKLKKTLIKVLHYAKCKR
ncbi:taste receptor type 2 member 40-like [Malaclemys terrapin pileata]|uniref:taste receptor type 2 member 40-like n=1 Tax=Malaclemys terrapin pileata TaxID=2991368 RepID=UPI0023A8BE89|nr:taste receptor type 2 member 40-like [Malaclemys terrapin pileata]